MLGIYDLSFVSYIVINADDSSPVIDIENKDQSNNIDIMKALRDLESCRSNAEQTVQTVEGLGRSVIELREKVNFALQRFQLSFVNKMRDIVSMQTELQKKMKQNMEFIKKYSQVDYSKLV